MQPPKPGDVILGKYTLTRVLGQGGMGIVYAAEDRDLGDVAIKFLLPEFGARPEVALRFLREAKAGRRLRSERVARVYAVDSAGEGMPFIVMEHLEGRDLADVLRERGTLPVAEAVDVVLQACEAVCEAHSLGIVHRDLKPGNLFVTNTVDGSLDVKVLDFGISKSADAPLTANAAVLGSPFYMSPEQVSRPDLVDARSDIWSIGVILYELLAGKRPFEGETVPDIYVAIVKGTYEDLLELRPDVPEALEKIIADALTLDREDRLASVAVLATRLAPFGTDLARLSQARIQGIAARAPSQPPAAPKPRAVRPRGLETVDSNTTATPLPTPAPTPLTKVATPTKPPRTWKLWAGGTALLAVVVVVVVEAPRARALWSAPELERAASSAAPSASSSPETGASPSASASAVAVIVPTLSAPPASSSEVPARDRATFPELPAASSTSAPPGSTACVSGATAACEAACTANVTGACHALARALEQGVGAPADPARAAKLYETECNQGASVGCNNLAVLYALGHGVPRSDEKAVELYEKACDAKNGGACANLGAMYFDGTGAPKKQEHGASLFQRACELGSGQGCLNLSDAYAKGQGVSRDPSNAFTYAVRGCSLREPTACIRVASAKLVGDGAPKDVGGGLAQLDASCTARQAAACSMLSNLYTRGLGADVVANADRAHAYAAKGCSLGDAPSCAAARR